MHTARIKAFKGLTSGSSDPPFDTAKTATNIVFHREIGDMRNIEGYLQKYAAPTFSTEKKISNASFDALDTFYIPDYGGREVTVLAGTYTKGDYFNSSVSEERVGIWCRPHFKQFLHGAESDGEGDGSSAAATTNWTASGVYTIATDTTTAHSGKASIKATATGPGSKANHIQCNGHAPTIGEHYKVIVHMQTAAKTGGAAGDKLYIEYGGVEREFVLPGQDLDVFRGMQSFTMDVVAETTATLHIWTTSAATAITLNFDAVQIWGWSDEWQELTENYIVKAQATPVDRWLQIGTNSAGADDILNVDTTQATFSGDYLRDWYVMNATVRDDNGIQMVGGVKHDATRQLFLESNGHVWQGITGGDKLYLFRNPIFKDLQSEGIQKYGTSASAPQFDKVKNTLRLTTGVESEDMNIFIGFLNKGWVWDTPDAQTGGYWARTMRYTVGLHAERADWDSNSLSCGQGIAFENYTGLHGQFAVIAPKVGLPFGLYDFGYTILLDDGTESDLINAGLSAPNDWDDGASVEQALIAAKYRILVNPALLPKRAASVCLYLQHDDGGYRLQRVLHLANDSAQGEFDLTFTGTLANYHGIAGGGAGSGSPVVPSGNWMQSSEWDIDGEDWTASASKGTYLTRAQRPVGTVTEFQYKRAVTHGNRRYFAGVTMPRSDRLQFAQTFPNTLFENYQHGIGVPQYDVIANDGSLMIDVDFQDGDVVQHMAIISDRLLVLKRKSLVMLTPDGLGGYNRDLLTRSIGCSSADSVVTYEDMVFWADYTGIYSYSAARGLRLLNLSWVETYRTFSDAIKEGMRGAYDPYYRVIRFAYNTASGNEVIYSLDTDNWSVTDLTNNPTKWAQRVGTATGFLFLSSDSGGGIVYSGPNDNTKMNGNDFTFTWESNKFTINHLQEASGLHQGNVDLLPRQLYIEADMQTTLNVELYVDDALVFGPVSYLTVSNRYKYRLPLGLRGKEFSVKLYGTTQTSGLVNVIKEVSVGYHVVPAHGTKVTS